MAGVWLLCESKVRQLMASNVSVLSDVCFIIVMIAAYPFLIYVDQNQEHRYHRFHQIMEGSIDKIIERIFNRFHEICQNSILEPSFESRRMVE